MGCNDTLLFPRTLVAIRARRHCFVTNYVTYVICALNVMLYFVRSSCFDFGDVYFNKFLLPDETRSTVGPVTAIKPILSSESRISNLMNVTRYVIQMRTSNKPFGTLFWPIKANSVEPPLIRIEIVHNNFIHVICFVGYELLWTCNRWRQQKSIRYIINCND